MEPPKKGPSQDSSTLDVETTTFISRKDHRRVERPHSFHNGLHEGRSEAKETSQIISLPETICRSTEKLLNRPVTNCKPLKRRDSETLSRDGPPGIVR